MRDGKNVLTRSRKPNIVRDMFTGPKRMQGRILEHFKKAGSGVLVYLRDSARPAFRLRHCRKEIWRPTATGNGARSGVGAQILRDLEVASIRHLTSSVHHYKVGFRIEIVSNELLEG